MDQEQNELANQRREAQAQRRAEQAQRRAAQQARQRAIQEERRATQEQIRAERVQKREQQRLARERQIKEQQRFGLIAGLVITVLAFIGLVIYLNQPRSPDDDPAIVASPIPTSVESVGRRLGSVGSVMTEEARGLGIESPPAFHVNDQAVAYTGYDELRTAILAAQDG